MTVSGFRYLDEETVHRGYAIEVAVARFESPDGREFTRDVVHHPGAVAVLPLHADGTVTLVRQYRAPLDDLLLEIPAGLRDVDDEPLADTAARELVEEVGLVADRLELLISYHAAAGHCDEVVHVFVATGLRAVESDVQGPEEEAMTIERIPLDELVAGVVSGAVTDSKTVIAALLAARRRPSIG